MSFRQPLLSTEQECRNQVITAKKTGGFTEGVLVPILGGINGQKLQHLFFMSLNVPPAVLPVWSAYEQTIDSYLQKRIGNDLQPSLKSDPEQRLQALINSTLKTLDQLDQARVDLMEGRPPLLPREFIRPPNRQASR